MNRPLAKARRFMAVLSVAGMVVAGTVIGAALAPSAAADPGPIVPPAASTGVTADGLPTVQVDGVVWSQVIHGNTVYVGGSFANARPAGSAPGQNQTPRANLLAFDVTTGALITSFAPSLNAQAYALAISPDGTRLYVGGDFTTAGGQNRYRLAAYDTATGSLVANFAPPIDSRVNAIVATNSTVYVGGQFSAVGNQARSRLAAFSASDGSLLAWNPNADYIVHAMVMTPDNSKLIIGGAFQNVNGVAAYGLAALDPVNGALLPWNAGNTVRDAGTAAAILSLTTDGSAIYGTGYVYGAGGNLEGAFSADPATGNIKWIEDCHGDTYAAYPANGVLYTVSHAHYCATVGGYPQTDADWSINMRHALAFTTAVTGTLGHNAYGGYADWFGTPSPSLINWFPDMDEGTYTGQSQAAWAVTANSQYVVLGGEFPTVNHVAQQGLVRFAIRPLAPAKQGPMISGSDFMPTLVPMSSTAVRVSFPANWDRDDLALTYKIVRNGDVNHPIKTFTANSTFWNRPTLSYFDRGLTAGASYDYRLFVTDPGGNLVAGDTATVTLPATGADPSDNPYSRQLVADGVATYLPMDESTGVNVFYDHVAANDADTGAGITRGTAGAISGDAASTFNGASTASAATRGAIAGPNTFSISSWFRTTSTTGGKIIGFGNARTGQSTSYDRQIYLDNAGKLYFGVCGAACPATVNSTLAYNDGQWHQVLGTFGAGGLNLYVDGVSVGGRTDQTAAQAYQGYWRIGGDSLAGWPGTVSNANFTGDIDEVAIFPTVLSPAQVSGEYNVSGRGTVNVPPTASFTAVPGSLSVSLDASASSDSDGTISSYAWNFGDGTTGTGKTATHSYAAAGTYTISLTVTDNQNATGSATKAVTVPPANQPPVASFTTAGSNLTVTTDASGSTDPDGTIASYAWTFGDGATATGKTASHAYAAAGTYSVTLTVTDNAGATNSISKSVTVTAPVNQPPVASFTTAGSNLTVTTDASGSTDPDGTIASYAWTFGDGATATGKTASHAYAAAGTYSVTLTVTDNAGATNSISKSVTVTAPANQPPVAAFTTSIANLTVTTDASSSSDPDGSISSYAWAFGDGSSGTGVKVSHTYAAAGTYQLKLTVTDNAGAATSLTKSVTVSAAATVYATDKFTRSATNSWGSASKGGSWTLAGPASLFSVNGSVGQVNMNQPAVGPSVFLSAVAASNVNLLMDVSLNKIPIAGGVFVSYAVRHNGSSDYRAKLLVAPSGSVTLSLTTMVNGTETTLQSVSPSGVTYALGSSLRVRFIATGSGTTNLSAKVWKAGTAEPGSAQIVATDTTPSLQSAGTVGLQSYLSSLATNAPVVSSFDNLSVVSAN